MKRVWRLNSFVLTLVLLPTLVCACSHGAEAALEVIQLPRESDVVYQPGASGDRVVWVGWDLGDSYDSDIFTWTPDDGLLRITDDDLIQLVPEVSGDRIVWQGNMVAWDGSGYGDVGGFGFEIFTWTPADGVIRITEDTWFDREPQVSGDRIVWEGYRGDEGDLGTEILTWTPTEGRLQLTHNDVHDSSPRVSGDRVVWVAAGGRDGDTDTEIFTWTPEGGVVQLTENHNHESNARVSGDRIVWEYGYRILTWTPAEGVVQLDEASTYNVAPEVSGDRVVWVGNGGSDGGHDSEVFTWTPTGGTVQLTSNDDDEETPLVSGDRVAWCTIVGELDFDIGALAAGDPDFMSGDSRRKVFIWTPGSDPSGTTTEVSDWVIFDTLAISADWVVWSGVGSDWYELFLAEPSRP